MSAKHTYIIPKLAAIELLSDCARLLTNERIMPLVRNSKIEVRQLLENIEEAKEILNIIPNSAISVNMTIWDLRKYISYFDTEDNDVNSETSRINFSRAIFFLRRFLENIISLSGSSSIHSDVDFSTEPVRNKDTNEEEKRYSNLLQKYREIKKMYSEALNEEPRDEERLSEIKEKLDACISEIIGQKKTIVNIKTDTAEEQNIKKRINSAFAELQQINCLNSELKKLKFEYYSMLVLFFLVILSFVFLYYYFLTNLKSLNLISWCDYLPYTMSVPITIALVWVIVYLKNRANKISIELNLMLYDVHYLEGKCPKPGPQRILSSR